MKKIFFILVLAAWLFPLITHAQIDARCWTETECYNARKEIFDIETPKTTDGAAWEKVFKRDNTTEQLCGGRENATHDKIGFCLPATTAKTKISIGGQTEFTGLAEFVSFIYKYGMGLAGVLSVLMIIFAGVQWIISGGNAEAISSAKHKIVGAVIGLVILSASYTILYTVNPDLVNLRPPNAWMINTQKISAPYCSDINDSTISKNPSNPTGQNLTIDQKKTGFSSVTEWVSTSTAQCGSDYFVKDTGALTCTGDYCPLDTAGKTQVCFDKDRNGRKECATASIAGTIYNTDLRNEIFNSLGGLARMVGAEGWTWIWVEDFDVYAVCNNGHHETIDAQVSNPEEDYNAEKKEQYYWISIANSELEEVEEICSDEDGVKGIAVGPDMNESGDITGARERHIVGRYPQLSTESNTSHKVGADLGDESNSKDECLLKAVPADRLIPISEIKNNGVLLDINASLIFDIDDEGDRKKFYNGPYDYEQNCL
ncbi:MAG TPA: pilin [Candidatus Magasanikbacteria bacterium]|nr:pilin [Candidatus Magasanikbacteria bacterium]